MHQYVVCCPFGIFWMQDLVVVKSINCFGSIIQVCCNFKAELELQEIGDGDVVMGVRHSQVWWVGGFLSALVTTDGGNRFFQTSTFSTPKQMLSQYELDRLDNIARNKAVLEALGLSDGLTGKSKEKPKAHAAPKPKSDDDEDDVTEPAAARRSSRHTGKVQHVELTDEDMLAEERESLRPKRATRVVNRFEDRQAAELQEREERAEQKRNAQRQRVAQEAAATKAAKEAAKQAAAVA